MPKTKEKHGKSDFFGVAARSKERAPSLSTQSVSSGANSPETEITLQTLMRTINNNTARIENAISQLDGKLEKLTNQITTVEERLEKVEKNTGAIKTQIQKCEENTEQNFVLTKAVMKENKELKHHIELLENQSCAANVRILGLPDDMERTELLSVLEKWIPEVLKLDIEEDPIYTDRAYKIPMKNSSNKERMRTTIIKLSSERDRDRILIAARKAKEITFNGKKILFFPDLGPETQARRSSLLGIKRQFQELNFKANLLYPAKLKVELRDQ
uniref:L1 transposable element RRM domain-containing protein n=1 Tax=Latimeria chalumnae TaxID=7897 RepID=H3AYC9_LATCH